MPGYPKTYYPMSGSAIGTTDSASQTDCWKATCTVSIINNGLGNNDVEVGAGYTARVTIYNTSEPGVTLLDGDAFGRKLGATNNTLVPEVHDLNRGIPPGESDFVDIPMTAPAAIGTYTINGFYPDYAFAYRVGPNCPDVTIDTYGHFQLSVDADANLAPTSENPDNTSTYYNRVTATTPAPVYAPTTASFQKNGANFVPAYSGGTFSNGTTDVLSGGFDPRPVAAGDKWCADVALTSYSQGYVGPGGSTDIILASGPVSDHDCGVVNNKPYFKANNSSVSAAGAFKNHPSSATGCDGGTVSGYFNTNKGTGSGAYLGAIATEQMTGFASSRWNYATSPTKLSFGNSGVPISGGNESPLLGGALGADSGCKAMELPDGNYVDAPSAFSGGDSAAAPADSVEYYKPASGKFTINDTVAVVPSVLYGKKTIYVDGDVWIRRSAIYAPGPWAANKVPSFTLHVRGNIYVDDQVPQLDGTYIAEPNNTGASAKGGTIYTCNSPNNFEPADANDYSPIAPGQSRMFVMCKNQLTVNGSFQAKKVKLLRTFGSLRDAQLVGGAVVMASPCSNQGIVSSPETCAAEVFKFSPEVYLSSPPKDDPVPKKRYDAISSLPPVL